MENATGYVDINSPLVRKAWMQEGMIQAASKSFWSPFTGSTKDAVVYQKRDIRAGKGDTVTFDYNGNIASEGFLGKERAAGKGTAKKKFSSQLGIFRGRWVVDNGDKFDAEEIDATDLTEHANSRLLLSDQWIRGKDQTLFDSAQGFLNGIGNSHVIRPNNRATIGAMVAADDKMSYEFLLTLEETLIAGTGFAVGADRRPLDPTYGSDGEGYWPLIITNRQKMDLMRDAAFRAIVQNADVRGPNNMLIKGVITRIGRLVLIEAPKFFGTSSSNKLTKTAVEISGLRQIDSNGKYSGEATFAASGAIIANRALLLGRGALQLGIGKDADYKYKSSDDFDITSESAIEVWFNAQKTQLIPENEDYEVAKVGGFDWGVIAVDTYHATIA